MQQARESLSVSRDPRGIGADPRWTGGLLGAGARTRMGKDWGAVHSAALRIGLETEMMGLQ